MLRLMSKKIFTILRLKTFFLSKPIVSMVFFQCFKTLYVSEHGGEEKLSLGCSDSEPETG